MGELVTDTKLIMTSMSELAISSIFGLFDKWGNENYIGENVTQLQHSQQAALQAEKTGCDDKTVLGAFLHDTGHLVGLENGLQAMTCNGTTLGTADHDKVGEKFLQDLGFPSEVTQFVRGHVQAKRYLVFKYPDYHDKLTERSQGTLIHQGGPMTQQEAEDFESLSNFSAILEMRTWDEKAKDVSVGVINNDKFKNLIRNVLEERVQ